MALFLLHLMLLIISKSVSIPEPPVFSCERPAAIAFLIDGTNPVLEKAFSQQLTFVEAVMEHFSQSTVHQHVITYSRVDDVQVDTFNLADATDDATKGTLHTDLLSQGDHAHSRGAFLHARDVLRYTPDEAARIVIYITSRPAHEQARTLQEAKKAKEKGILIYCVGVGQQVNLTELGEIATESTTQFVRSIDSFENLEPLSEAFGPELCKVQIPAVPPVVPCRGLADIVFLVDTSRLMDSRDFPLLLEFVQDTIEQFDVSADTNRVAFVSYSEGTEVIFDLQTYQSTEEAVRAVGKVHFTRGHFRHCHEAIKLGRELLAHARPGAVPVIIFITTGMPTNWTATLEEFAKVKKEGILMVGVGAGRFTSFVNKTDIYFLNTNFYDLSAKGLGRKICPVIPVEPATTTPTTTEKPVTEEPVTEEPVTEEPMTEEPITEEPMTEEPMTEEPITEEPMTEEPVTEEPMTEEPVTEEPMTEEPVTEEPTTEKTTKRPCVKHKPRTSD